MSEKTVIITEAEGKYKIQNNGIPEFALIGILESVLFDLKSVNRRGEETITEEKGTVNEEELPAAETIQAPAPPPAAAAVSLPAAEKTQESTAPDLRTRIGNAVKAITALGGQASEADLSKMSDEELQSELDELTSQYKRLKKSKETKK